MKNSKVEARGSVVSELRREIYGPLPTEVSIGSPLVLEQGTYKLPSRDIEGPFYCPATGQEAINNSRINPHLKYGVGVLNPRISHLDHDDVAVQNSLLTEEESRSNPKSDFKANDLTQDDLDNDDDLLDLSTTADRAQSSMGLTFAIDLNYGTNLELEINGGTYRKEHGLWEDKSTDWWIRTSHSIKVDLEVEIPQGVQVGKRGNKHLELFSNGVTLVIHYYSRKIKSFPELLFVTIVLENITESSDRITSSLYQSSIKVLEAKAKIMPYPENLNLSKDDEYLSIAIQDRDKPTFAIGHGTATDWGYDDSNGSYLLTTFFPSFEIPSITPNIDSLNLDLKELARGEWETQKRILNSLLDSFREWVVRIEVEATEFEDVWRKTALSNASKSRQSLSRMERAVEALENNTQARLAFTLTNQAILDQQYAVKREKRYVKIVNGIPVVDPINSPHDGSPVWRPFQLGFLLQAIPEIIDPSDETREIVDLIFFPTGGGKTEAYLGLTAFSILMRRLVDPKDIGVNVLMRYTLRLLTSQQFTRAASLICCLELIRQKRNDLGIVPIRIGVWLGGEQTPNSLQGSKKDFDELMRGESQTNKFLLLKCPYCGTQMGPLKSGRQRGTTNVAGYYYQPSGFFYRCNDIQCPFGKINSQLPVIVIDEQIYDLRPDLVIGTVDKFAQIAWNDKTRGLFGLNEYGDRTVSPPNLIIQDELHLISGPLGSMAGLYEVIVQDLCTDKRKTKPIRPKIVASTATVARFQTQILSLFGRESSLVFPPPILDSKDSFFSRIETIDGVQAPGRLYLGIFAPGYSSYQTIQVRVGTSLIQAPMRLPDADRDPYWTGLWFFNSIRELGNTQTLIQSDMHDYSYSLHLRDQRKERRFVNNNAVLELTSRMQSDEVPAAIDQLEKSLNESNKNVLDICLASNIIEVGIDIDRLGLLVIAGQPKSTSQYIQVSGRVGRDWKKAPGLVVTIYSPLKPRDRSHFERFRSYHQKLYHYVEATSVTPYSDPVLDRALHAILVTHVRMNGNSSLGPSPYPASEIEEAKKTILESVRRNGLEHYAVVEDWLNRRVDEWNAWEKTKWTDRDGDTRQALMRAADVQLEANESPLFWKTPNSLRNVDAECPLEIFNFAHLKNSNLNIGDANA
jgi:hypothetical protein